MVQHLLYNYVAPIFERRFIYDSYSCRIGKGTLMGVERFEHHLRSVTDNYRSRAWILQLDIRGYFMSIVRDLLYGIIRETLDACPRAELAGLDLDLIDFILRSVIFRNPVEHCNRIGSPSEWDGLPDSKSLLKSPPGVGLPIGDLTSQLFSNIYLNELDQFVKRELKCRHYGRYVDDFFLMDRDRSYLEGAVGEIRDFLAERLHLKLHPHKVRLAEAAYGGKFLGAYVMPYRRYVSNRTVGRFHRAMRQLEEECERPVPPSLLRKEQMLAVINSYCGYLGHFRAFRILDGQLRDSPLQRWFAFTRDYRKAKIRGRGKVAERLLTDDMRLLQAFLLE